MVTSLIKELLGTNSGTKKAYNETLIDGEYKSSNIVSQKEVFLVISHNGAIPIYQLLNIQCMHGPHCY